MTSVTDLKNIPAHFRPSPFWSWNDELEPEELRRQIRLMHQQGLGGFFMHARGGLRTKYMGHQWLECVKACVDEAAKLGMDAWLYDENGWPSGFGGSAVNTMGLHYQQKYLRYRIIPAAQAKTNENTICFYTSDGQTKLGTQLPEKQAGDVLECYYDVNRFYVDNMDASVVAAFLQSTHEKYAATLTPDEMKHIRGIFTDEPQLSRNGHLWSFILPEEYRKAYQLDLMDDLPKLFLDMDDAPAARIRFWGLCARLFSVNFLKQIADWCEAHGLQLTGHHVLEETYLSQLTSNGAIMPQYVHYHVPGGDHLGRSEMNIINMRQVTSVAAQTGKAQVLSETFACTGWSLNMRGMKWMFQYQMAHDINYLCQHLFAYSMRGMRKRDYPLSSSMQNPWWEDYRDLNDYFSRVCMLLASGDIQTKLLVIHGQSTAWTLYNGQKYNNAIIDSYSNSLLQISAALDAQHLLYHYSDENLLDTLGSWTNGELRIGKMTYDQVILPQVNNLSKNSLSLIQAALQQHKKVYGVRNLIQPGTLMIDGVPATREQLEILSHITWFDNEAAVAAAVAQTIQHPTFTENGVNASHLVCTSRYFQELCGRKGQLFYVVNRRAEAACTVHITLPGTGTVEVIDTMTGEFSTLPGREFDWDFAAAGAALFFVNEKACQLSPAQPLACKLQPVLYVSSNNWLLPAQVTNMLTLDKCQYRVDDGEWIADDVCVIHDRLLKLGHSCHLAIRFTFFCEEELESHLQLGLEKPENFTYNLNGVDFQAKEEGFLYERAIKVIDLPAARKGENTLTIETTYCQRPEVYAMLERAKQFESEFNMRVFDTEIESVYLLGAFSVKPAAVNPILNTAPILGAHEAYNLLIPSDLHKEPFVLANQQKYVDADNITRDGFPFFTGKMAFQKQIMLTSEEAKACRHIQLDVQGFNTVRVFINGQELGKLLWSPYLLDIPAGVLQPGANTITLQCTTSLRNMLGPHHSCNGDNPAIGPLSFGKEPNVLGWNAPDYQPDYCLIRNGIQHITLL